MSEPKEQQAEGHWKQFTGRVKEAWGALSDDNLDRFRGKRDQLVGYIQQKTGESRDKIRQKIDKLAKKSKEQT